MNTNYPIIIHGSENSLDIDAYVLLPQSIEFKEAKKLCDSYSQINANLLVVTDGMVSWCYKGTKDECNNSILATYALHKQNFESPITQKAERGYGLKMLRTVRGLLSYASRTDLRKEVKQSLVSDDLSFRIEILRKIDLNIIKDFEKSSLVETYKFFAFQMGQSLSLLQDNVELFTKNSVAQYYPKLKPYLDRDIDASPADLQDFLTSFADFVSQSYTKVDKHALYCTKFHGVTEVLDCKAEKVLPRVAVFDIDGTLMDETHRKEFRETKQWDKYFELCHLDTPIEHIVDLTKDYKTKGYEVWLMSGRSESVMEKTLESMKKHGVMFDKIKLRGEGNFIPDYVIKPAWISKYIGLERVEIVFEDTDKVIEGFRKKGLNVIDVKTYTPASNKTNLKI